jgi:protein phosphatase
MIECSNVMESESHLLETNQPMTNRSSVGQTDPGALRSVNQDSFYIDPKKRFFIVADGMGGHAGGQEASQIATRAIQAYLNESWEEDIPSEELLEDAMYKANADILRDQYENPERSDMGTTSVVVAFRHGEIWCAHIGDSRLYRLRGDRLEQITEDHTWVARALKMGDISLEQARSHPWRHVLFQCLGRKDLRQVDIYPLEVQPKDVLLLCSDGLTEEVTDTEILELLQTDAPWEKVAQSLINAAIKAGGSDNITVVLICEEGREESRSLDTISQDGTLS